MVSDMTAIGALKVVRWSRSWGWMIAALKGCPIIHTIWYIGTTLNKDKI